MWGEINFVALAAPTSRQQIGRRLRYGPLQNCPTVGSSPHASQATGGGKRWVRFISANRATRAGPQARQS
jgi:hypothetical protein